MASEYKIRVYQPKYLEAIVELAKELDRELAERFHKEPNPDRTADTYINHYLKQGTKYRVLVTDGSDTNLCGYTIGTPTVGMPEVDYMDILPISSDWIPSELDVDMVFVSQQSRQRGIAKELILSLSEHAKEWGHKELSAYVAKWNTPSIALFRSLRFQEQEQESRYRFSQSLE